MLQCQWRCSLDRYERLELLERGAVLYLKQHTGPGHCVTAEMLADFLNDLAARWGCHYTVRAHHLRARTGNSQYSFAEPRQS